MPSGCQRSENLSRRRIRNPDSHVQADRKALLLKEPVPSCTLPERQSRDDATLFGVQLQWLVLDPSAEIEGALAFQHAFPADLEA
jgi:hypothetical protein